MQRMWCVRGWQEHVGNAEWRMQLFALVQSKAHGASQEVGVAVLLLYWGLQEEYSNSRSLGIHIFSHPFLSLMYYTFKNRMIMASWGRHHLLHRMPTSYIGVPEMKCHLLSWPSFLPMCTMGVCRWQLTFLDPFHPCSRPRWSSGHLALLWSVSGGCSHLGNESKVISVLPVFHNFHGDNREEHKPCQVCKVVTPSSTFLYIWYSVCLEIVKLTCVFICICQPVSIPASNHPIL